MTEIGAERKPMFKSAASGLPHSRQPEPLTTYCKLDRRNCLTFSTESLSASALYSSQ